MSSLIQPTVVEVTYCVRMQCIAGGKSSSRSINSRQSGLSNTLKLFLSGLKYTDPRTTNLRFIFWKPCNCNPLARNLRLPIIHYPPTIYYHLDISTSQHSIPNQHPLSPPSPSPPPPPPANQPTNFHFSQGLLHIYPYESFSRQRQITYTSLSSHSLRTKSRLRIQNLN